MLVIDAPANHTKDNKLFYANLTNGWNPMAIVVVAPSLKKR